MTLIEEVANFAREYINKPSYRTPGRRVKIKEALYQLTGENILTSCRTCYIEALFKILKSTQMATSKYELKRGVVLQVFGDPTKTCTNNTITDAIGDWYQMHHPEKMIYFVRYPELKKVELPPPIEIKPKAPEPAAIPTEASNIIAEAMSGTAPIKRKRSKAKK